MLKQRFIIIVFIFLLFSQASSAGGSSINLTIMPLGDSITADSKDSYRIPLLDILNNSGYHVDFVGSMTDFNDSAKYDQNHEGHGGWQTHQFAFNVTGFISNNPADVVLIHIGTNDVLIKRLYGYQASDFFDSSENIKKIVKDIYNNSPNTKILISTIIIINDCFESQNQTYCGMQSLRNEFNNMLRSTVSQLGYEYPVYIVEMNTLTVSDLKDSVHPNKNGSEKIANQWFTELQNRSVFNKTERKLADGSYTVSFNVTSFSMITLLISLLEGGGYISDIKIKKIETPIVIVPNIPNTSKINIVRNPSFDYLNYWTFYAPGIGMFTSQDGVAKLSFWNSGSNIQLFQTDISLKSNTKYQLSFSAYSNSGHDLSVSLHKHTSPYTSYGLSKTFDLSSEQQVFTTEFTSPFIMANDGRLRFWFVPYVTAGDIYYIDNVELKEII